MGEWSAKWVICQWLSILNDWANHVQCPDMSRYVQICPEWLDQNFLVYVGCRICKQHLGMRLSSGPFFVQTPGCSPECQCFDPGRSATVNMLDPYNVGPPVIRWFINPMNTIVIGTLNHSYWSYVHQLSYRLGAPLCRTFLWSLSCPILPEIDTAESNGGLLLDHTFLMRFCLWQILIHVIFLVDSPHIPTHPNTSQHIPRICVNSGSQSFHKRIEHVFTSLFQRKKSCFFGSIIFHQDRNYRNWLVVDLPLWKIWVRQWEGWHPIYYGK